MILASCFTMGSLPYLILPLWCLQRLNRCGHLMWTFNLQINEPVVFYFQISLLRYSVIVPWVLLLLQITWESRYLLKILFSFLLPLDPETGLQIKNRTTIVSSFLGPSMHSIWTTLDVCVWSFPAELEQMIVTLDRSELLCNSDNTCTDRRKCDSDSNAG